MTPGQLTGPRKRVAALAISLIAALGVLSGCARSLASNEPVDAWADLLQVCKSGTYYRKAPPRLAGSQPYPAVVYHENESGSYTRDDLSPAPAWQAKTPASAVLVVCARRVGDTKTGQSCHFDNEPQDIPLHEATYALSVYETRTGVGIGGATIKATQAQCPRVALFKGKLRRVYSYPTTEQYVEALTKFATTSRK